MENESRKTYWMSPQQRDGLLDTSAPDTNENRPASMSRRRFLEAAGFTASLVATGCGRAPQQIALPLVRQPEGTVPGRMQSYASTCAGCSAACGMLVGVRDGRPLKMEGMPEHPLSKGGLCAVGQAQPLGLYDSRRLFQPLQKGEAATWNDVDQAITGKLKEIASAGGAVRLVSSTVTSPTLQATIDAFLEPFDDARHVTFDTESSSAILDAHEQTHRARVLPHFRLDRAKVIAAFGADFLGTWISPIEFTAAWRTRRVPIGPHPEMSYHVQLEGRMSLTGSNADRRIRLAPDEYGTVLSHLATRLAEQAGQAPPAGSLGSCPLSDADLSDLSERLWNARGESVILCDSPDGAVQVLVNYCNHLLGNYGQTVEIDQPSRQRQGSDADVSKLIKELHSGKVSALLVASIDLTYHLPDPEASTAAIGKVPLVISFADRIDDFTSLAGFVCPDHHPLESWLDAEPVSGLVSLSQPTLQPLGDTRSILESLARWSGRKASALEIVQANWKEQILPRSKSQPFQGFWDQAVHDGFAKVTPRTATGGEFQTGVVDLITDGPAEQGYALTIYSKIGLPESRHAHNPWLQELPDPVTKATWDNYVCISESLARELDLSDGDVVRVASEDDSDGVELPVLIQPGQHDRVLAIARNYGVAGTDRFANVGPQWIEGRPTVTPGERVGKNVARLMKTRGVTLVKTGKHRDLARAQRYHSLEVPAHVAPHGAEVRDQIQETTLAEFLKDPHAGTPEVHHHGDEQLWAEDHSKTGHAWGMVIDLNACSGCSACLIACQSENNVPVVGKDEVRRQREMHWIRIDRYYSGEGDEVDVSHQPMMCQHCDNAPCETVCPVLATVHSEEGLNEQVYNRCVGTRYCANNCPYKVRRFNWFDYPHDDTLQNLALAPDVTVRTRGVMEKCSMCVQRIEAGRIDAKGNGVPLADGDIQTACQQSCPAQAITFGDMNDPDSRVHAALEDPRRYRVLEEFNFRPSVAYQRVVRNRDELSDGALDGHAEKGGDHV